jgi:hypothetical protein
VVDDEVLTRKELIRKLVTTDHLNVPERRRLVPLSVGFSEILAVIDAALEAGGLFPPGYLFTPGQPPKLVGDATVLQKMNNGNYRLYWQRAYPWDPSSTAERMTKDYDNLPTAAAEFVRIWWGSDIDGIPIVTDK